MKNNTLGVIVHKIASFCLAIFGGDFVENSLIDDNI